jgi:hypothetical protein
MREKITATQVSDDNRMNFMPKHLGRHLWQGQNLFPSYLERLSADYSGGYWAFYELSNGGWYSAPMSDQRYGMFWPGNGYEGEMSADAAGITASLYALCQLANTTEEDAIISAYHLLRDFAVEHAEGQEILSAID